WPSAPPCRRSPRRWPPRAAGRATWSPATCSVPACATCCWWSVAPLRCGRWRCRPPSCAWSCLRCWRWPCWRCRCWVATGGSRAARAASWRLCSRPGSCWSWCCSERRSGVLVGSPAFAHRLALGLGRALGHVQRQRRLGHQVGADRRGDEQERGNQELARLRVGLAQPVVADRGQQHAAHAQGAGLGRRVQALEELGELHQADRADQDEEGAGRQQEDQQDGDDPAHSTMSLRSTYLLSTTVLTKPSMAMISAASK